MFFLQSQNLILCITTSALCGLTLLFGCSEFSTKRTSDETRRLEIESLYEDYRQSFKGVLEIDPVRAIELMQKDKVVFIDERKPEEQTVSMLPNSITAESFLHDPSRYEAYTKVSYCTISYRSGKLALKMQKKGIEIYNLKGGILAWVHAGGSVYDQDGVTNRIHVYGPKWNLAPVNYQAVW